MTGSTRKDKAVWWVSGFALGAALLMLIIGDTLDKPLLFAAVPAILCAILYGSLGPWLYSTLGRILFSLIAVVAVLLSVTWVNHYWDYAWQFAVAEVSILFAGVVLWTLLAYLAVTLVVGCRRRDHRRRVRRHDYTEYQEAADE